MSRPHARRSAYLLAALLAASCRPNNPYRSEESGRNIYYSTFSEPPKHLDPAVSYSSDEYRILGLVYEPPLQYHYLKRPYELIPNTAERVPRPVRYGRGGERLPPGAPPARVAKTVYEIRIRRGIAYQPHPCFALDDRGRPLYRDLPADAGVAGLARFERTGSRELVAADYVRQIKRLADPTLSPGCPILPVMEKYIEGLAAYADALRADLAAERERRRDAGESGPVLLDLDRHPLAGAVVVDRYTYRLTIIGQYPQILYWLAMPFFSPMPQEALDFYGQAALAAGNVDLNRYPVGTGPYRVERFRPRREIVLVRNGNFHGQRYPSEGEDGDRERGLLRDAGKPLPFIGRIVLKLETESIPRWLKFLQGYYDGSGIPSESFDQAVEFSPDGDAEVSRLFETRGIRLEVDVNPVTYYFAFNMLDDTYGGYAAGRAKLRRAIAIAIETEERIQIFLNGRGITAQSLIPPGIFGHETGRGGIDPFVFEWDERHGRPRRRPLEEARRLIAEAGYPGGKRPDGRPLELRFANPWMNPASAARIRWLAQKLDAVGVRLVNETTDYNRFQEKAAQGNYQLLHWGWHADYPDPENFLFLLYGPNGQVKHQGSNHSNYDSPDFNRLFKRLETMESGPARLDLIRRANRVAQRDAPLVGAFHPVRFGLYHAWVFNTKPHASDYASLKYLRIDPEAREAYRATHNRPRLWPLGLAALLLAAFSLPALGALRRRLAGRA